MNMTTFTDKQLKVMAAENTPRGLAARAELLRRKDQSGAKGLSQDEPKQEVSVETSSKQEATPEDGVPEGEEEKPKRNTRRKRTTKSDN